jgi:Divergent InlB B-repeat domain
LQHDRSRRQAWHRIGRLSLGVAAVAFCAVVLGAPASGGPARALHGSISVSLNGSGSGRVTGGGGIDCPGSCYASLVAGTVVELGATPDPGSAFDEWGGACSGSGDCSVTISEGVATSVSAGFSRVRPSTQSLAVSIIGKGRVSSAPAGIDCNQPCAASFPTDSSVTLSATAFPGWTFAGWSGACTGTGSCALTMGDSRAVTATFAPPETSYALAVAADGGVVTSDIDGISCGEVCTASYGIGVGLTLTAAGSPVSWEGACPAGGSTCSLTMDGPKAVSARVGGAPSSRAALAVAVAGKGSITSDVGAIACGSACGAVLPTGSRVLLTVAAVDGWLFAGWRGACSGVARTCTLTLMGPTTAIAEFVEAGTIFPLAVSKAGNGRVISRPAGVDCGSSCSGSFQPGSTVLLEAEAAKRWTFVRWGGSCTAKGRTCAVPMDGPKSVSVVFGRITDQEAPVVKALPSQGEPGRVARLRYRVSDASGKSREWAIIFRGSRRLATVRGKLDAIDPDALYYFLPWRVPSSFAPSPLRFCVFSVDPTGNRSKRSCAPLTIR